MKIILIRHGQTDANKNQIIQGWLDFKLNKTGIKQAKLLSLRLKKEKIDAFYSSDLKRAVMTMEEIKKYHLGKKWVKSQLLRERSFGSFEGMKIEKYYKLIKTYGLKNYEFRPPFGESYFDVRKRVERFFRELNRRKEKNVVIVAHGAFNRVFIAFLLGLTMDEANNIPQENTCVNVIEIKSRPKLTVLNDTSHLNYVL